MLKRIIKAGSVFSLLAAISVASWAEQTWTVNFKDSDIEEVIKFVADVTGKTTVIDQRVKGRVKVISSNPLNEEELLHLFRTVLEIHDFTLVEVDDVIRVVPLKDARSSPVPVTDQATKEQGFVTQVIQLQNIAAAKVLPVIRPLVPQHSHLAAYDPSNSIVISDSIDNIARIRSLIERIDKSATPVTDVVELRYASADEMVTTLTKIDKDEKARSGSQNTVTLIADKRNNAVLVTGEELQRQRIKILLRKLDKPKPQTGNVRVIYLDYAKAKPTAEVLTKIVSNLSKLGPGGGKGDTANASATVEADEDTNALLITAEGDTLNSLLEVVDRLDIRRAQVLVEAIIVETLDGAQLDLGVSWMFRNTENGTYGASDGGGGPLAAAAFGGAVENGADDISALTDLATALAGTTGQVLGIVGTNKNVDFNAVIDAMEGDTKTNILSTPTLLTLDNSEASFTVGQNVPFVTGSFSNSGTGVNSPFQTIQREDVGITLKVTPQINEGDKVVLDISQEISSISESADGAADIITNQRKIETKVLTADGEVVVMGGFIQERAVNSERRVPVLGSIPLVGRLFRSDSDKNDKTNLMIFIRATVIRDDSALTGATAEKYKYIRDQQLNMRDRGFMRVKENSMPLLPDMSEYDLSPVVAPVTTEE
ncbi:type II secretion system secretin GspD [Marinagarivorans cellulosilyticus]|uniref:General secretion pathway protein D n=1 Tax=Marinagarivorans cellulosilyticus TaxID=2721545 RepID=A0AAN1WK39_9GAMM|nr:type II secretion system secretin GspD [Marinagarivorans cellulosilyticus]BCD99111.1 general secretion pathway protein D [Marinagarivorans cellulosilyticus]